MPKHQLASVQDLTGVDGPASFKIIVKHGSRANVAREWHRQFSYSFRISWSVTGKMQVQGRCTGRVDCSKYDFSESDAYKE